MMRPWMRLAVVALTLVSVLGPAVGAATPALAANCQYVLGFKALHDRIPNVVGNCVSDEQHNPNNGDGLQPTTGVNGAGGLLAWRKADNWTAFTDGFHTWINGPNGLQERLNSDRFPWEADYAMVDALTLGDLPAGFVVDPTNTGAVTNAQLVAESDNPLQEQSLLQKWGRLGGYEADYLRSDFHASSGAIVIINAVGIYKSSSSAQLATADPSWSAAGSGWQAVSAPVVGDQSVAFTGTDTITIQGQSLALTLYEVRFRVGNVVAKVGTAAPAGSGDLGQTINLAQAVVRHVRARG